MADEEVSLLSTPTTNYGWAKPTVGADNDAWGGMLNTDLDGIDSTVKSVSTVASAALPLAGGTLTGNLTLTPPAGISAQQVIGDNRIVNGDMRIDQRNNGVSGTAITYTADRWTYGATQVSKFTWQRGGPSPTLPGIAGFAYYLICTSSSAFAPAATDSFYFSQKIEGDMISDFAFGMAGAQPVTLSFWAFSSLTGTFGGSICNDTGGRSYPFSFSISATNTWAKYAVTIPGDAAGTWVISGNACGMIVRFDLGSGANFRGAAGAWAAANLVGVTGSVSVVGTNGATFALTGVKLEIGNVVTPFPRDSLAKSLADCQRYYVNVGGYGTWFSGNVTSGVGYIARGQFPVQMRANPTIVFTNTNANGFPTAVGTNGGVGSTFILETRTANAAVNGGFFSSAYTADAEL